MTLRSREKRPIILRAKIKAMAAVPACPPSPSGEGKGVGPVRLALCLLTGPTPTPPLKGRGLESRATV